MDHSALRKPQGFALVVTLSITALLVLLVTGLLLVVRSASSGLAARVEQTRTEANATLSSRLALGSLQKLLGRDQAVTAPGNILSGSGDQPALEQISGVWHTAINDPSSGTEVIWNPAVTPETRDPQYFAGALLSQAEQGKAIVWEEISPAERVSRLTGLASTAPSAESAQMLGAGSLPANDLASQVFADLITVSGTTGQARDAVAWWASDESQKAVPWLPNAPEGDPAAADQWSLGLRAGNLGAANLRVANLWPADITTTTPLLTRSSLSLQGNSGSGLVPWEVGVASNGVIVDVRRGGLRQDLSLAFETRRTTADAGEATPWSELTQFHNANEKSITNSEPYKQALYKASPLYYHDSTAGNLGYLFVLDGTGFYNAPGSSLLRGPAWDVLQNHYRSYKREWEALNFRGLQATDANHFTARPMMPADYSWWAYEGVGNAAERPKFGNFAYYGAANARYGRFMTRYTNGPHPHSKGAKSPSTPLGLTRAPVEPTPHYWGWALKNSPALANPADTTRARQAPMQPVVTRAIFAFGIVKGAGAQGQSVYLTLEPSFTIWNPYDVPLDVYGIGMSFSSFHPAYFRLEHESGANRRATWSDMGKGEGYEGAGEFRFIPPGGRLTLQPGQLLSFAAQRQPTAPYNWTQVNLIPGRSFTDEASGRTMHPWGGANPTPNTTVNVRVTPDQRQQYNQYGAASAPNDSPTTENLTFMHMYPQDHSGGNRDVMNYRVGPFGSGGAPNIWDFWGTTRLVYDEPLLQSLSFHSMRGSSAFPQIQIDKSFNETQIPQINAPVPYYLAALDLSLDDPLDGDSPVFAQSNPRAQAVDPRDSNAKSRLDSTWNYRLEPLSGTVSNLGVVGTDGFGKMGSLVSRLSLYEVPRRPLTSLASLQSANLTEFTNGQGLAVGNSWPNAMTQELNRIRSKPWEMTGTAVSSGNGQEIVDWSYAANEALWDRYFFSGANWGSAANQPVGTDAEFREAALDYLMGGGSTAASSASPWANWRVQPHSSLARNPEAILRCDQIAQYLYQAGAFNVNSTSVDVWKAVLSGNAGGVHAVQAGNSGSITSQTVGDNEIRVSRFQLERDGQANDKEWPAVGRTLDDGQLTELATAIVDQVKLRGPFFGLADFVNRRLVNGDAGKVGALQAAIDATSINADYSAKPSNAVYPDQTILAPKAAGTPQFVSQADLLTSLAPALTARGDTFTVRALARHSDSNQVVSSQKVLEVVIQRTPELLSGPQDPSATEVLDFVQPKTLEYEDTDGLISQWEPNPNIEDLDRRFGRRFRIISQRWLNPDEI